MNIPNPRVRRALLRTFAGAAALAPTALAVTPASAEINLELRPATQSVWHLTPGAIAEVGLYAVSDDDTDQLTYAIQAIIQWDPDDLQLLGTDPSAGVPLQGSGFPPGDPFGLNEANPPLDGDAMYVALAPLGEPVVATPQGSLIVTFGFAPLQFALATPVEFLESAGDPPGETIVFDGEIAGLDVTGTLTGCVIHILPCCPPDLDYDCLVGVNDFLVLVQEWGTDPGGPPDLDGDGDVGVTDFLLLIAAWGPCPAQP